MPVKIAEAAIVAGASPGPPANSPPEPEPDPEPEPEPEPVENQPGAEPQRPQEQG